MDPQQIIAKGRAMLIEELNIGHLPKAEQDAIVDELGELLLRRVLTKLFALLPANERDTFQTLLKELKGEEAQKLLEKHVPNPSEVINAEMRAGIDEHKELMREELAKATVAA